MDTYGYDGLWFTDSDGTQTAPSEIYVTGYWASTDDDEGDA